MDEDNVTYSRDEAIDEKITSSMLSLSSRDGDDEQGRAGYERFKSLVRKDRRHKRMKSIMGIAAALVAVVAITGFLSRQFFAKRYSTLFTVNDVEVSTPQGQRAELTLPDGTRVWLNSKSKITYPNIFKKERKVSLVGEAYFCVAKDKQKPFIVSATDLEVEALGTEFNVFSYPEYPETSVSLEQGSVRVCLKSDRERSSILTPGECAYSSGDSLRIKASEHDHMLWKNGFIVFKNERLEDIIKKLESYFDVSIIVKDNEILDYEYVGKFRTDDGIATILETLQKAHRFNISKDEDNGVIILSK